MSCHYDVVEWLNPDWIIDCNKQEYTDRRLLWQDFKREEQLNFQIKQITKESWSYFRKYHYLSEKLHGGDNHFYGLFKNENQIGFLCFSNYVPHRKGTKKIYHFNRLVIHPDFSGFGLGISFINKTSEIMKKKDFRIMGKFSSVPVYKSLFKDPNWKLLEVKRQIGKMQKGKTMNRNGGFRENIKTYSFEFVG